MPLCAAEVGDTFGVIFTGDVMEVVTAATEGCHPVTILAIVSSGDLDICLCSEAYGCAVITVGTAVDAVNEV